MKYSEYSFSYTILPNELWVPGEGKIIADSVTTTIPIIFIFTRYCLFSVLYRFMKTVEILLGKIYIEGALMRNLVMLV